MKTKAIYAGSFDPFTYGHLSVVLNALRTFDEVRILVAYNPTKLNGMFTPQERVDTIREVVAGIDRVSVDMTDGYVVVYGRKMGCTCMVRGVRDATDAKYELVLAEINAALVPEIQTVFIPSNPTLSACSSSRVKELFAKGEGIDLLAPAPVILAMKAKAG